ncbi:MAG: T9SS type A sorting domain-containing protein [Candidatus Aegiribacteria sp.]|nr:T9SS type A sorting domain-containing protein [Candidatus Aegiribacteria sp.]
MILMIIAVALLGDVYDDITVTRNPDPNYVAGTYEEWLEDQPDFQPFFARTIMGSDGAEFLLVFENGLTDSLEAGVLEQWTADIASQGLSWEVVEVTYSTPEDLKSYLTDKYNDGLEGAVLVGILPTAWVMLENSFGGNEHFPCDYFLMDLDGTWEDLWVGYPSSGVPGSDGKYDTFSGSLDPEIYTGRIKVDNLNALGDPIEMLNDYIERNHVWRMNGGPDPLTALLYVDDDWAGWSGLQASMQHLYPNTILVNDIYGTNGTDYLETRLPDAYVWISPFVHSSPNTHYWAQGPSTNWDEIVPANPQAHFYNLFACSNARFTTTRCMGAVYAFCTSAGLASVGSTKTGSMMQFTQFYYPMGQGASIGEAYKDWWDYIATNGLSQDERSWHLGMVLLGDPSLMPAMHMLGIEDQSTETNTSSGLIIAENPCQSELVLTYAEAQQGTVELYDTSGRLVASGTLEDSSCTLSLSSIQTGFYIVKVTAAGISAQTSVVILR